MPQVGLPGVGRLYSEGKASARLEVEQQLVERLALKSPLVRPSFCRPHTDTLDAIVAPASVQWRS